MASKASSDGGLTFAGVEALQISDKMFSQCLVALVTSFAHSLKAAAEGRLNGAVEYGGRGAEAGRQWLRLVASRGCCSTCRQPCW